MPDTYLLNAVFGGIRNTHFFNGRILTAEALEEEQKAQRAHHALLGQAVGDGVVTGLTVKRIDAQTLSVEAGVAVNRNGQALELAAPTTVAIGPLPSGASDDGLFHDCVKNVTPTSGPLVEGGAYALTVFPASQRTGSAPKTGFGPGSLSSGCDARYDEEGVRFKVVALDTFQIPAGTPDTLKRNLLAHWCLEGDNLATAWADPFTFPNAFAPADRLPGVTPCDVPLATFFWRNGGVQDLDLWSVRRRVAQDAATELWGAFFSDRRLANAQARLLQFQTQLAEITANVSELGDYFRYVPPVCFVPVDPDSLKELKESQAIKAALSGRGFDLKALHKGGGVSRRIVVIDGDVVEFALHRSWFSSALDTFDPEATSQLYAVKENLEVGKQIYLVVVKVIEPEREKVVDPNGEKGIERDIAR